MKKFIKKIIEKIFKGNGSHNTASIEEITEKYSDFSTIGETLYLRQKIFSRKMCFPNPPDSDIEWAEYREDTKSLRIAHLICWRVGLEAARAGLARVYYYQDDNHPYCHPADEEKFSHLPYPHMAIRGVRDTVYM